MARYLYEDADSDGYDGTYEHLGPSGCDGVSYYVLGWEVEPDEDTEWSGYMNRTGKLVVVMVGDDRHYLADKEDLRKLKRSEYCASCGQIGCCHDIGEDDDDE